MQSLKKTVPVPSRKHPLAWLSLFGPGAVIASLTIGSGELIFSTRGGAIFGYRLLGIFLLVCLFKWTLVLVTARHMVLTGVHPFERWARLGGPHGWLPVAFLLLGILAFPVWVGFHAGTLGTLAAHVTRTTPLFGGSMYLVWGLVILSGVLILALTGGYRRLETIQLIVVFTMLASVMISLVLIQPDWLAMARGLMQPHLLAYPAWAETLDILRERPVWVELATYVGVVGGSGYDYLAYVSYLRAKKWGQAGTEPATAQEIQSIAANPHHPNRQWLRAPLIDCTISFAIVFLFSAVFLAGGTEILGAQKQIPDGTDLLTLQAEFVTAGSTWLRPVYFAGAFLAMLGTLYGTLEVAPAIFQEIMRAVFPERTVRSECQLRRRRQAVIWTGAGGLILLAWMLIHHHLTGSAKPPGLVTLLTPANLFTGVFACGLICALALWADWKWLPESLRPHWPLTCLTLTAGVLFFVLGIKGYWDHSGASAFVILAGTLLLALAIAKAIRRH